MPYAPQNTYENAPPESQSIWDQQVRDHGRMTNMKRTLAHSANALRAYMEWYPLKDEVAAFTSEREAILFAHAISTGTDCLICSTFFRKVLIEWGEDPGKLELNARENALVAFGQAMAKDYKHLPHGVMKTLQEFFSPAQLVSLTAFGGIMIATNIFNDVLEVDLDEYLYEFKAQG